MGSGYFQDAEDLKKGGSAVKKRLKQYATDIAKAEGGAGNIESPAGTTGTGVGATIKNISDALPSRREQGVGSRAVAGTFSRPPDIKTAYKNSAIGVAHGEGLVGGTKPKITAPTAVPDTRVSAAFQKRDLGNRPYRRPEATTGGGVADRLITAAQSVAPTLATPSKPRSVLQQKAFDNMAKSEFGPDQGVGGRDVYEMKDGERTGRILESSTWLPTGKAFSSNAWEKTVGGQPNIGYDPNAVQPAGYYQEGGTFIHGPRFKPEDLEGMIARATKGIKDESAIAAITSALSNAMSGVVGVPPEGTGAGPEKERGLKERIAKIAAEAEKSKAAIAASASKYRSDTAYYSDTGDDTGTTGDYGATKVTDQETGQEKVVTYNKRTGIVGGGAGKGKAVSKDRIRVIKNQIRDLKGKEKDDYIDSLPPEEFNAVKGSV